MTSTLTSVIGLLLATSGVAGPALAPPHPPSPGPPPGATTAWHTAPTDGVWPLEPRPAVVSGFDPPLSNYGSGHRGVDLAGTSGQRVRAAAAGRVTYAGSLAGRGVVVVSHGATRTTYQPVRATVEVGALVEAGDPIGRLEPSGSHCAPEACLHWGLIEGATYLDPLTLVGAGPVRLLPFFGLNGAMPAAPPSAPFAPVLAPPGGTPLRVGPAPSGLAGRGPRLGRG